MGKSEALAGLAPPHGPETRILEEDLARLWYEGALGREGLRTRCGRRVRVLYRGLPNGGSGPDYRGAVLSFGRGKPRTGDIELHVRTSHWREHGHHRDPGYNSVILHVVWQDDDPGPTRLSNGGEAPVLGIRSATSPPASVPVLEPCRNVTAPDANQVAEALDRAGDVRFLAKASRFEGDMAVLPAKEVLYQRLAEAMGYTQNKWAFQRLAEAVPLDVLEGSLWARPAEIRERQARALLLGTAGLLAGEDRELVEIWTATRLEPQLTPADWRFGVRPGNHPVRRIAFLASLIASTIEEGLVGWAVRIAVGVTGRPWPWLPIGRDRGLEVAVNVLLPFAYAWGQTEGDERLSQVAHEAYRLLPAPGSNQVTRHMSIQLLGTATGAGGARRQQGLLHFFHCYCTKARCGECEMSRLSQGGWRIPC